MHNKDATQNTLNPSSLHLSQKAFWFSASICLLLGTIVFSWQVIRGRAAAVEVMGIKFTSEKAEQSIVAARDSLLTVRTRLTDASEREDMESISECLPQLDDILKSLGVAEAALKHQQLSVHELQFSDYDTWTGNDYGVYDNEGFNYGGGAGPRSPTPPPKKKH